MKVGVVLTGEGILSSTFAAMGAGRGTGLDTSSKLEASSSSSSTPSSSWNLDAKAAIEPFCSDIVGGGERCIGAGSTTFFGSGAFTGVGAGADVGGL